MTQSPSEHALRELVTDLLETRDPLLYHRAYNALDALLSGEGERWSRLSEQNFRFDKWSLCRG